VADHGSSSTSASAAWRAPASRQTTSRWSSGSDSTWARSEVQALDLALELDEVLPVLGSSTMARFMS
jgi:hypothetical protein